jgi:hypothetical protein
VLSIGEIPQLFKIYPEIYCSMSINCLTFFILGSFFEVLFCYMYIYMPYLGGIIFRTDLQLTEASRSMLAASFSIRTDRLDDGSTSETSLIFYHTTRCNNSEDSHLQWIFRFNFGPLSNNRMTWWLVNIESGRNWFPNCKQFMNRGFHHSEKLNNDF